MTKGIHAFFRWERDRLLRRTKKVEYWDGEVNGHPAIIKRFPDRKELHWREYLLQSRIRHPLLLPAGEAGIGPGGRFSYSLQCDAIPTKLEHINDSATFAAQVLSLAYALERRGLDFRWDPGFLLQDRALGAPVLPGLGPIRSRGPRELSERGPRVLSELRQALALYGGSDVSVEKTIRKWERRKEGVLQGCLQDMMASHKIALEVLPTWFEVSRTRELELIAGLLQLAKQSCGRSLLFLSDPGEGKSTLLSAVERDLLLRNVEAVIFRASPESRPYHSIRRLLDQFYEQTRAHQEIRDEKSMTRRLRDSSESLAVPEEALLAEFLRTVSALRSGNPDRTFVLLIDDLDAFDSQSLSVLGRLVRSAHSIPILIVATSTRRLDGLPEPLVLLSLETPSVANLEDCCVVPLWKPEQRRLAFQNIHMRTSGNMLLFQETLRETLRQSPESIRWDGGEWSMENCETPALPDSAAMLYLRKSPALSAEEVSFLEAASVQGGSFDPHFLECGDSATLLASLREKGILLETEGRYRFRRTVVADFLYQRMDAAGKKAQHLQLAEKWNASGDRKRESEIARHYLKAGRLPESLDHACRASARIRFNTSQVILPILEELESKGDRLTPAQKLQLYCEKAELLFRRGRYPAACEALQRALPLAAGNRQLLLDLNVRIAESRFLNNDILAAQTTLKEVEPDLAVVPASGIHIRFYFCRGACSWHRGHRERSDFERALALAEEHHDYESLACGYRQLAELALRGGVLQEARTLAGRALKFARKTRSRLESGHALRLLGTIAWHRSLHRTAEKVLNHSIRHFTSAGSLDGVARVWSILGNVCVEQYRFAEAISAFQKASELYSQLDHPLQVSLAQFNLGLVYVEQGRLKEAEKIYLRCRSLDRKAGNKRYYAYDLRALAVICVLRGFHRKATRLLQRVLEICTELQAEGDILQTRMILLMNELEQKNYRQAKPLVEWLEGRLSEVHEPMAIAEIHYLVAHYNGYINESAEAEKHLQQALRISRRIHYYKLIGMCHLLKLVFAPTPPARKDPELRRGIAAFRKSKNELRLFDYLLKLYQAHPALLREREHAAWLIKMERMYRQIRHRSRHRAVRELAAGMSRNPQPTEPLYEWWYSLLRILQSGESRQDQFRKVLAQLSEELHASAACLWYSDPGGSGVQLHHPFASPQEAAGDFHERAWKRLLAQKEDLLLDVAQDQDLAGHVWAQWHDIRSLLAVPVVQDGRIFGMWYFERWGAEPPFTQKDLTKAAFFSLASSNTVGNSLRRDWTETRKPEDEFVDVDFVGSSAAMQNLRRQITRLAPLDISVLIQGESGTGKELIAGSLHRSSPRCKGPFLALNCSAIPEGLVESELFGHAKGAFTGAVAQRQGYIERAHGGTLFLDEVGDLSLAAQAKLLRVLQEKEIHRVGETAPRKVDVRFVFATHKDLQRMVREGTYRQDLFYRISVYTLWIPPLRDRREDVLKLIAYFTERYARSFSRTGIEYSAAALQMLSEYAWPGNVREMENVIQSILVNAESGTKVEVRDLPQQITGGAAVRSFGGLSLENARQEFEREFLKQALARSNGNKTRTAKDLGITRQGLIQMLHRLGLETEK